MGISSRWEQLTGMSCEQARNSGRLEVLHPEEMAPTMKALKEALNTGQPIDIVHRVKTVNGKWKLHARGSPSCGPSGKIVRWYGGWEDVDEFKGMKEALR
jgi:PAS domain S-box-containing protein